MKKLIFLAIFLACLSPFLAQAQAFTPDQQSSLDALKQELIDLLTQEVASLQAQLQQLLAQQQQTQASVVALQQQVATQPVTPVFGTPQLTIPTNTISVATTTSCVNGLPEVPITITGDWVEGKVTSPGQGNLGLGRPAQIDRVVSRLGVPTTPPVVYDFENVEGTYPIHIEIYDKYTYQDGYHTLATYDSNVSVTECQ